MEKEISVRVIRFALACTTVAAAIATGASAAAAGRGSQDDAVMAAFKQICLDTGAETAAVNAAAGAHGWKKADAAGEPIKGFTVDNKTSHTISEGDATLTLFGWHGSNGAFQANECQVSVTRGSMAPLRAAVATELGFQPQQDTADKAVFQFSGKPGAYQAVDKTGMDAAVAAGGLELLTVSKTGSGMFLELLKLSK